MEGLTTIKQRFEIIGNDPKLNRSLEKAMRVAPTDISVLVTGESGVGKETIPKIIHQLSHRKHANYIAVNCGAIPEGTIDSELFGHEKGAFTGATNSRKGYFEVADGDYLFGRSWRITADHTSAVAACFGKRRIYQSGVLLCSKNQCENCRCYQYENATGSQKRKV